MKKNFIFSALLFSGIFYAQTCENIKLENTNLKTEIQTIKTENDYLKKVLEINNPILESEKENNNFRITKVVGNKADKTISITFLVDAKDPNIKMHISNLSLIDLEGNEYKVDYFKSSSPTHKLPANVPLKIYFTFKAIVDQPLLIKLFRFSTRNEPEGHALKWTNSKLEFRDLKVNWN